MPIALATALCLALSGCSSEPPSDGPSLLGKTYLASAMVEGGEPRPLPKNTQLQLEFTNDGQLNASVGCNAVGGKVTTSGGTLLVADLAVTRSLSTTSQAIALHCDPSWVGLASWLTSLLITEPALTVNGGRLELKSGNRTISFFEKDAADPGLTLTGTTWLLQAMIRGETGYRTDGIENARLIINGDRVTGSTTCNDFAGSVSLARPHRITFGRLAVTRQACAGTAAKGEQAILKVLRGEVAYFIEGDRLKLRPIAVEDLGLDYSARY